jgi:hypothetical protein
MQTLAELDWMFLSADSKEKIKRIKPYLRSTVCEGFYA